LNQQIKGWTMYHRYAASKRTFNYVDHRIFQMVWHSTPLTVFGVKEEVLMRQDVAATISVGWAETGKPQPPNGVGDVASRPERSYRFLVPSSSPQAGAGLAPGASGALEPDVSQRLYLDTAELDLHGVALGLVR
jgi:hypothetical protein